MRSRARSAGRNHGHDLRLLLPSSLAFSDCSENCREDTVVCAWMGLYRNLQTLVFTDPYRRVQFGAVMRLPILSLVRLPIPPLSQLPTALWHSRGDERDGARRRSVRIVSSSFCS